MGVLTKESPHLCVNTVHWLHEEFPEGVEESDLIRDTATYAYGSEPHVGFEPEVYLDGLLRYCGKLLVDSDTETRSMRALAALPDTLEPNDMMLIAEARKDEPDVARLSLHLGAHDNHILSRKVVGFAQKVIESKEVEERPEQWVAFVAAIRGEA